MARVVVLVGLVVAAGVALPPAVAQTGGGEEVARERGRSAVAAGDGFVAWNSYVESERAYRLVVRAPGAEPAPVAVGARPIPFDLDIGRGTAGQPVLTYSRCSHEPRASSGDSFSAATALPPYNLGRGCRLHEFDLRNGRERRIGGASRQSRYLPSRWGHLLAYVEVGPDFRNPRAYLADLRTGRRRTVRALPRSNIRYGSRAIEGPFRLDLRGTRLALSITRYSGDCVSDDENLRDERQRVSELLVTRTSRPRLRLVRRACQHRVPAQALGGAALAGSAGDVAYARVQEGARPYELRTEYLLDGERAALVARSDASPLGVAVDGDQVFIAELRDGETLIKSYPLR